MIPQTDECSVAFRQICNNQRAERERGGVGKGDGAALLKGARVLQGDNVGGVGGGGNLRECVRREARL